MKVFRKFLALILSASLLDFEGMSNQVYAATSSEPSHVSGSQDKTRNFDFQSLNKSPLKQYTNLGQFSQSTRQGRPFLIHIRDLHCNYEAQMNIAKSLEALWKENPDRELLVLTEGADGLVDTNIFGSFPDRKIKEEASKAFVKEGKITGPEYLSITKYNEIPIRIQGVEDAELYVENFKAFRDVMGQTQETQAFIEEVDESIGQIKRKVFSKELLELDEKDTSYEKGTISFDEYIRFLSETTLNFKLETGNHNYPNYKLFIDVLEKQKKLSLEKVEEERNSVMNALTEKVSKEELGSLIKASLEFRLGKISAEDYFGRLEQLIEDYLTQHETGSAKSVLYPNLIEYISLIKIQGKVDHQDIQDEVRNITITLRDNLTKTEGEREILEFSKYLSIIRKMLRLELTREDLAFYLEHKEFCNVEAVTKKLDQLVLKYSVENPKNFLNQERIKSIAVVYDDGGRFYELALKRDEVMVEKALKITNNPQLATRNRITVLITGGFHSEGVTELLKKKDVAYLVMTPKVTAEPNMTTYYNLMLDERISIAAISFFSIFNEKVAELLSTEMRVDILKDFVDDIFRLQRGGKLGEGVLQAWVEQNERKENLEKSYREMLEKVKGQLSTESVGVERVAPVTQEEIRELIWDFSMLTAEMTVKILPQMRDEKLLQYARDELEKRRVKERLAAVEFPRPQDLELLKHNTTYTWRVRDKRTENIWYLKLDLPYLMQSEKIGYLLSEAVGVNIPRWSEVPLSEILVPEGLKAEWAKHMKDVRLDPNALEGVSAFLTRDVETIADEELVQKDTSGLEELLTFLALTGGRDFDLDQNLHVPMIQGKRRYLIYDLASAASDVRGAVSDGRMADWSEFSFNARLIVDGLKHIDLDRLDEVIQRIENLPSETFRRFASRLGLDETETQRFLEFFEIRKRGLRRAVAYKMSDAASLRFRDLVLDVLSPRLISIREGDDFFTDAVNLYDKDSHDEKYADKIWDKILAHMLEKEDLPFFFELLEYDSSKIVQYAYEHHPHLITTLSQIRDVFKNVLDAMDDRLKSEEFEFGEDFKKSKIQGQILLEKLERQISSLENLDYTKSKIYQQAEQIANHLLPIPEASRIDVETEPVAVSPVTETVAEAPANVKGGGVSFDQLAKWIADGKHDLALANFRAFARPGENLIEVNREVLENLRDFFADSNNFNHDEIEHAKAQEKLIEFARLLMQQDKSTASEEATLFHGSNLYALHGAIMAQKNGAGSYRLWSGENAEKYGVPIFRVEPGAADHLVSLSPSLMTARGYASKAGERNLMSKGDYIERLRKNLEETNAVYAELPEDHPIQERSRRMEGQMNLLIEALEKMDEAEFQNIQRLLSIPIVIGASDAVMTHRGVQHSQVPEVPIEDYVDFENEVVEIRVAGNHVLDLAQILGQMGLAHKIRIVIDDDLSLEPVVSAVDISKLSRELARKEAKGMDWLEIRLTNDYFQVSNDAEQLAKASSLKDMKDQLDKAIQRENETFQAGDTRPGILDQFGIRKLQLAIAMKEAEKEVTETVTEVQVPTDAMEEGEGFGQVAKTGERHQVFSYKVVKPEKVTVDNLSFRDGNDAIGQFIPRGTDIARILSVARQTAELSGNLKPVVVSIGAGASFTESLLAQKGARVISVDPNALLLEEVAKVYGLQRQTVDIEIDGKIQTFVIYRSPDSDFFDLTLVVADAAQVPYVLHTLENLNIPPFPEEIRALEARFKTLLSQYSDITQRYIDTRRTDEDLGLSARQTFDEVLKVSKELEMKKSEFRRKNPSGIDLVFNSWMPQGVDFSEGIRDLGSLAIIYVTESGGATGFEAADFYEWDIDDNAPNPKFARLGLIKDTYSDSLTPAGYHYGENWYAPSTEGRGSNIIVQLRGDVSKKINTASLKTLKISSEDRLPWDYKSFWKGSVWDGVVGRGENKSYWSDQSVLESVYDSRGKLVLRDDVDRLRPFENHPGEFRGWEDWSENSRRESKASIFDIPSITATLFKGKWSWLKNLPVRILFGIAVPVQEATHIILAKVLGLPVKWSLGNLWSSVQIDYTRAPPWKMVLVRLGGLFSNVILGSTALAIFGAPAFTLAAFFALTNIGLFISDLVLSLILRRGDFWDALRDLGWVKGPEVSKLEEEVTLEERRGVSPIPRAMAKGWEVAVNDSSPQGARLRTVRDTTGMFSSDQEIVRIARIEAARALADLGFDPEKYVLVVIDSDAANAAFYPEVGEQVIEISMGLLSLLRRNGILDKETLKFIFGHEAGHALINQAMEEDKDYQPSRLAQEYQADEYGLFGLEKGDGETGYTPVAALKLMEALRREQKDIEIIITTTHPHTHRRQVKIFNDIRHNYWSNLGAVPKLIDGNSLDIERGKRHQFDEALYGNLSLSNIQKMLFQANSVQDVHKIIHLINILLSYKTVLEELRAPTGLGIEFKDDDIKLIKNVMDGIFGEKGAMKPDSYADTEKYLRDEEINVADFLGQERVAKLREITERYYSEKNKEFTEEIFNDLLYNYLARLIVFKQSEIESSFSFNRSRLTPFTLQNPITKYEDQEGEEGYFPGKFRMKKVEFYQQIFPDFYSGLSEIINPLCPELKNLTVGDRDKLINLFFAGGLKYLEGQYSEEYESVFDGLTFDEPFTVLPILFEYFRRYENEYLENTRKEPWARRLKGSESQMILNIDRNTYYRYVYALGEAILKQIEEILDRYSFQDLLTLYQSYVEHKNTLPKLIQLDGMREQEYGKKIRDMLLKKIENFGEFKDLILTLGDLALDEFDNLRRMENLVKTVDQNNLRESLEFLFKHPAAHNFLFKNLSFFIKHALENLNMDPVELKSFLDELLIQNDFEKYWNDKNYRINLVRSEIPEVYSRSYAYIILKMTDRDHALSFIDQYYSKANHKFSPINRGGNKLEFQTEVYDPLLKALVEILKNQGMNDREIFQYFIEHGYLPLNDVVKSVTSPADRAELFELLIQNKPRYLANRISEEHFNTLASYFAWEWFFVKEHMPEYTTEKEITKDLGGLIGTEIVRTERRPLNTLVDLLAKILPSQHNERMLKWFFDRFEWQSLSADDFNVVFNLLDKLRAYFPLTTYALGLGGEISYEDYQKTGEPKYQKYLDEAQGYPPFYFRDVENIENIFALELGHRVMDQWLAFHRKRLDDPAWDIREKIALVLKSFPEKSNNRDKLLVDLFEKNIFEANPAELELIIDHLVEGSRRDLLAKRILIDQQQKGLLNLSTFERVKAVLDRYFPEESSTRRELMNLFLQDAEVTLEELKILREGKGLAQIAKSKKKSYLHILLEYVADDLENRTPQDKLEIFEWLSGFRDEKPKLIQFYEYTYKVNLTELREFLSMQSQEERYAFVGTLFVGPNGILSSKVAKETFLKKVFENAMGEAASEENTLFLIFSALFDASSEMKQLDLVHGLFEHFVKRRIEGDRAGSHQLIKKMLISFGVVGVKLGQILSNKPDLIRDPELRKVLSDLSDRVEPLGKEYVLGALLYDRAFEALEGLIKSVRRLLGSASIKQGYLVRMLDGTERVLKYVRPLAHAEVRENLQVLRAVLSALRGRISGLDQISNVLIDQVEKAVQRELDMASEIQNQEEIGNFSAGISEEGWEVTIPKVDKNLKGKQYFADEFKPGRPLKGDVMEELKSEGRLKAVSKALLKTVLRQVFVLGKYHGDLHPGNILIDKENKKVVILDFGNSGSLSGEEQESFINLFSFLRLGFSSGVMRVLNSMVDNKEVLETQREEIENEVKNVVRSPALKLPEKVKAIKEILEKRKINFAGNVEILFKFLDTITYISDILEEKEIENIIMEVLEEKYKGSIKGFMLRLYGVFGYVLGGIFGTSKPSVTASPEAPVTQTVTEAQEIPASRVQIPNETITVARPDEVIGPITDIISKSTKKDFLGPAFSGQVAETDPYKIQKLQELAAYYEQDSSPDGGAIGKWDISFFNEPRDGKIVFDVKGIKGNDGLMVLDEEVALEPLPKMRTELVLKSLRTDLERAIEKGIPEDQARQIQSIIEYLESMIQSGKVYLMEENEYLKGYGTKDYIFLSKKLFDSASAGIGLFHEAGESYFAVYPDRLPPRLNAHTLLRGLGKGARNGSRELTPVENALPEWNGMIIGLQDLLVGPGRNVLDLGGVPEPVEVEQVAKIPVPEVSPSTPMDELAARSGKQIVFSTSENPDRSHSLITQKDVVTPGNYELMIQNTSGLFRNMFPNKRMMFVLTTEDGQVYPAGLAAGIFMDNEGLMHLEWIITLDYPGVLSEIERYRRSLPQPETLIDTMGLYVTFGPKGENHAQIKFLYLHITSRLKDTSDESIREFFESAPKNLRRSGIGNALSEFLTSFAPIGSKIKFMVANEETLKSLSTEIPFEKTLIGKWWKGLGYEVIQSFEDIEDRPSYILEKKRAPILKTDWQNPGELGKHVLSVDTKVARETLIDNLTKNLLTSDKEESDQIRAELENLGVYSFVVESSGNWNLDFRNGDREAQKLTATYLADHPEAVPLKKYLYDLLSDMAHNVGHIGEGSRMVITLRTKEILSKRWLEIRSIDNGMGFKGPIEWSMRKRSTTVERKFGGGIGLPSIQESVMSQSRFNRLTVETRRENEEGERITWSAQYRRGESVTLPQGPSGSKITVEHALFKEEPQENLRGFVEKFFQKYTREPTSEEIALYFGMTAYEVSQMTLPGLGLPVVEPSGVTQKHIGTKGMTVEALKNEIDRIPVRSPSGEEKAQVAEMLDVIQSYAPEVLERELGKLSLDASQIGLEALKKVLEALQEGRTDQIEIEYNGRSFKVEIRMAKYLPIAAHAVTDVDEEKGVIRIAMDERHLDALPHELIEALLLTRPENKSPPSFAKATAGTPQDDNKLKEHAVHTKMVLLEPLFDPAVKPEERGVDGKIKGRVARDLGREIMTHPELKGLIDGTADVLKDIDEKERAGAINKEAARLARNLAQEISSFAEKRLAHSKAMMAVMDEARYRDVSGEYYERIRSASTPEEAMEIIETIPQDPDRPKIIKVKGEKEGYKLYKSGGEARIYLRGTKVLRMYYFKGVKEDHIRLYVWLCEKLRTQAGIPIPPMEVVEVEIPGVKGEKKFAVRTTFVQGQRAEEAIHREEIENERSSIRKKVYEILDDINGFTQKLMGADMADVGGNVLDPEAHLENFLWTYKLDSEGRVSERYLAVVDPIHMAEIMKYEEKLKKAQKAETAVSEPSRPPDELSSVLKDLRGKVRDLAAHSPKARVLVPEVSRYLEEEILPKLGLSDRTKVIQAAVGELRRAMGRSKVPGTLGIRQALIPNNLKDKISEGLVAKGYPKDEVRDLWKRLDKMIGPAWIDLEGNVRGSLAWIRLITGMMEEAGLIKGERANHAERMARAMMFHEYAHQMIRPGLTQAEREDLGRRLSKKFLKRFDNLYGTQDTEEILAQFISYRFTGENAELFEDVELDLESFLRGEVYPKMKPLEGLDKALSEKNPQLLKEYGSDIKRLILDYRDALVFHRAGLERFTGLEEILNKYLEFKRIDDELEMEMGEWNLWDLLGEGETRESHQKERLSEISKQVLTTVEDEKARRADRSIRKMMVNKSSGILRAWERLKGVYESKRDPERPRVYVLSIQSEEELTGLSEAYRQMTEVDPQGKIVLNTSLNEDVIRRWLKVQGISEDLWGKKIYQMDLTKERNVETFSGEIGKLIKESFRPQEDMILILSSEPSKVFVGFPMRQYKVVVGQLGKKTYLMPDVMGLALILGSVDNAFENGQMKQELKDKLKQFLLEVAKEYFESELYEEVKKEIEEKIIPEIQENGFFRLPTWTKNFNNLMREYAIQQTYIETAA